MLQTHTFHSDLNDYIFTVFISDDGGFWFLLEDAKKYFGQFDSDEDYIKTSNELKIPLLEKSFISDIGLCHVLFNHFEDEAFEDWLFQNVFPPLSKTKYLKRILLDQKLKIEEMRKQSELDEDYITQVTREGDGHRARYMSAVEFMSEIRDNIQDFF